MNIDAVAAQIRTIATAFGGNVAGAAQYANAVEDQVWLPLPAAYVVPDNEDAEPSEDATALQQIVRERVSVIVVISTINAGGTPDTADRRGQAAAASFDVLRAAIFKAILNWRPNQDGGDTVTQPSSKGIYYIGARYPAEGGFDRARAFRQFTFGLDTTITEDDGWKPTGTALTDVRATVTDQTTGDTLAVIDAAP